MDYDAELQQIASRLNKKDFMEIGHALGIEDETVLNLKERTSSRDSIMTILMQTWINQHHELRRSKNETLHVLQDKLASFEVKTTAPEARENTTKSKKFGIRGSLVLAGLFWGTFLEIGTLRTLSLILRDLEFQYDVSSSYLGAIYGVVSGIYASLAFVTLPLLRYIPVHPLIMAGGIVSSGSLVLASFTYTVPQLTTTLMTFSIGYILMDVPLYSCVNDFFGDRFEIAAGVMTSGGSAGVMIMPWVFELVLSLYGWRAVLLLLGGWCANFIVIGVLVKNVGGRLLKGQRLMDIGHSNDGFTSDASDLDEIKITAVQSSLEAPADAHEGSDTMNMGENENQLQISNNVSIDGPSSIDFVGDESQSVRKRCNCTRSLANLFSLQVFKQRPLIMILCIQVFLFSLPYATWLLFTIPNAQAKGLSDLRSAQISIAGGFTNFIGRFSGGFIISKSLVRVEIWVLVANLILSVTFFVNFYADSFLFLSILSAVFGLMIGFNITCIFIILRRMVGEEFYRIGYSLVILSNGTAFPVAGYIAGSIYDRDESYDLAFFAMAGLSLAAGIMVILPPLGSWVSAKFSRNDSVETSNELALDESS